MKKKILIVLLFIQSLACFSQVERFNYAYDFFGGGDLPVFVQETNYGYLVGGTVRNTNNNQVPGFLRIDKQGNVIEKKVFDLLPFSYYAFNGVFNPADSCVYMVGELTFPNSDIAAHLIKVNQYGDTLWTKIVFDTTYNSQGTAIYLESNGDLIIAGSTDKTDPNINLFIKRIDTSGSVIWEKTHGVLSYYEQPWSIDKTSDGGYIIGGSKYYYGNYVNYSYVLKVDSVGDFKWHYTYGSTDYSNFGARVVETENGKIISAAAKGFYLSINDDLFTKPNLSWFDSLGNNVGYSEYDEDSSFFAGFSDIHELNNDEYILTGTFTRYPDQNIGLFKTNSQGDTIFARTYTLPTFNPWEVGVDVKPASDGGYVIAGYSYWTNDFRVIKVDSLGCDTLGCQSVGISENENLWNENNSLLVFPNPNNGKFFVQVKNIPVSPFFETRIEVYDLIGKLVYQTSEKSFRNVSEVDISSQTSGIYIVKAYFDNAPVGSIRIMKE